MTADATTQHVRPLDGLRGLAVGMVVLVHLSGNYLWGALGVNVFFALSGFLITGILLRELDRSGGIDKIRFYVRRALRLYPALVVGVLLAWVVSIDFGTPDDVPSLAVSSIAALTYTSNFVIQGTGQQLGLLNHTWTLSVEEQFYLLWPVLLTWGAFRRNLFRILPAAIVVLVVVRALLSDQRVETLLPAHADQLMLGALLAAAMLDPQHRVRVERLAGPVLVPLAAVLGFVVLILAVPSGSGNEYPFFMAGGYTAAAALALVAVAHVLAAPDSVVSKVLSIGPLTLIGRVSYGIYLYHFPIVLWAERQPWLSDFSFKVVALALTAAVVAASWRYVERPALDYKDRLDARRKVAASA